MTPAEIRTRLEACRSSAEDEARRTKDSTVVAERLRAAYTALDAADQPAANSILCEWLTSEEEARRFDAEALVDDLRIVACVPALVALRARLATKPDPSARYEVRKVDRVLDALRGGRPAG